MVPPGAALQVKRLGAYWTAKIAGKTIVVFGVRLSAYVPLRCGPVPNAAVWLQLIAGGEAQPCDYDWYGWRHWQGI